MIGKVHSRVLHCCYSRSVVYQSGLNPISLVFFLYEAAITSGAEVRYFWKSRISSPAVLYFLNKYVAVAQYALTLAVRLPVYSDLVCVVHVLPLVPALIHPYSLARGLSECQFQRLAQSFDELFTAAARFPRRRFSPSI